MRIAGGEYDDDKNGRKQDAMVLEALRRAQLVPKGKQAARPSSIAVGKDSGSARIKRILASAPVQSRLG